MGPAPKRPRLTTDDSGFTVEEVESASSNLRSHNAKKPKVNKRRGSVASETTLDAEQEESSSDLRSENDTGEIPEASQARQEHARQRKAETASNTPAENGIIESVTCINFMCHSRLEVPLGPLINFIIGHNGSGKSAVLTALTICLGGKASSTNRGQSLKDFIKEGQDTATLIVRLKNAGPTGFQQEVYGDSIIVERSFNKAGASSFKVKGSNGKTVSSRKADVEAITDYFTLQLDNPMNVLSQDSARQFLSSSTATEKYRFFVKGVQLEQLDNDYILLAETIEQLADKLAARKEDLRPLESKRDEARRKLKTANNYHSHRQKVRAYQERLAWARVEEREKDAADLEESLHIYGDRVRSTEEAAKSTCHTYDQSYEAVDSTRNEIEVVADANQPLLDEKREIKDRSNVIKSDLSQLLADERVIKGEMKAAKSRIQKAIKDIDEETRKIEEAGGGDQAVRLQEIEDAKAAVIDAKAEFDNHRSRLRALEEDRGRAHDDVGLRRQGLEGKRGEIDALDRRINTLRKDKGDQWTAFHDRMPQLLRAIQNERGFTHPPVGPIGRHIRLLDPDWSTVLEKSFGGMLNSFLVTTKSDQTRLSNVMRKVGCNCQILIGVDRAIDCSQNEPDPKFDTTLRVLEIDNELVRSQLIINHTIEQTILIKNREEANRVMYQNGQRLRNVKQCFALNQQRRGWGVRLGYNRNGDGTSSFVKPDDRRPRMKTDVEAQISTQQENLRHLRNEHQELQRHLAASERTFQLAQQAIQRHGKESERLRRVVEQREEAVERLQDELDRNNPEDGRLNALRKRKEDAEEELRIHERSFEELVVEKDAKNQEASSIRAELQEIEQKIMGGDRQLKKAQAAYIRAQDECSRAMQEKSASIEAIEAVEAEQRRIEQQRDELLSEISEMVSKASRVCDRIPLNDGDTPASLEKKVERMKQDMARYSAELRVDPAELEQRLVDSENAFVSANSQIEELEDLSKGLKAALSNRRMRWEIFQRSITGRAKHNFHLLLSERGFRGTIRMDHKQKILDLNVEPDETRSGSKGRGAKTLSGGEKSFSTICLLLSLWDAMGSPIRCLDEFDVFMDNVNRDVSMKMMIGAARRAIGRQYILITPQAMNNINVQNDVKIIKLGDPERGQTQLNFG